MNPDPIDTLSDEMLNDALQDIFEEGSGDRRRRRAGANEAHENLSIEDMLKSRGIQLICLINGELREPLANRAEARNIEEQLMQIARRQIRKHLAQLRAHKPDHEHKHDEVAA